MAKRYIKRCSTSSVIRKMQIKTPMSCHLTPVRMPVVKRQQVSARMWRKGSPSALLVGMQTGVAAVEDRVENPHKLQTELPYDPGIPLLGMSPKVKKTLIQTDICTLMFTAAIIYNS